MIQNSSIKITLDEDDKNHINELGMVLVSAREVSSPSLSKLRSFTLKSDEVVKEFSEGVWQFKFKLPNGSKYSKLIEIGQDQDLEIEIDLPFKKQVRKSESRSVMIGKNKYRSKSASMNKINHAAAKLKGRKIISALGSYNSKGVKIKSSIENLESISQNVREVRSFTDQTFDVQLAGYKTPDDDSNLWSIFSKSEGSDFVFPGQKKFLNVKDNRYLPRISKIDDSIEIPNNFIADRRRWLEVRRGNSVTFHSLPAEWWITKSNKNAEFELIFKSDFRAEVLTQLYVKDVFASDLLSRLNSREITDALTVTKSAKQYLFQKVQNPTLAAAGGYVLLATQLNSGAEHNWFDWLENLSNMNNDISDSEILLGYLYLNGPSQIRNVDRSITHFKKAYDRGIPHFTLGLIWFLSALRKLKYKDDDLEKMYLEVDTLARKLDPSASFTTFKIKS